LKPLQSRIILFDSENVKEKWKKSINQAIKLSKITDFYEIKNIIGKGKYGQVRLGIHIVSKNKVAIKIITKSLLNENDCESVKSELAILVQCHHPNIIQMIDFFENEEFFYFVFEYLEGGTLLSYLEKRKFKIPEKRIIHIIHSISTAIYYCHKLGIIHRDLKPENCFLVDKTEDSDVKIVDFGLATMLCPSEKSLESFGTLTYVAPEILLQTPYNTKVDIWSLGVLSYLIMIGELPFEGGEETELALNIAFNDPNFKHQRWKEYSKEAKKIVKSLLIKDPKQRPKIEEVLRHPFLLQANQTIFNLRNNASPNNEFKLFSLIDPQNPNALFWDIS